MTGEPESFPVAKGDKIFSDTNQAWGVLTVQRNPSFSKNPFVYGFVERETGDQEILSLVQGCEIKFKSMRMQSNTPLPFNMSKEEEILVDLEVQNLLAKSAIEICSSDPNQFISNIFTIPKKDGGRRPMVDMQELN